MRSKTLGSPPSPNLILMSGLVWILVTQTSCHNEIADPDFVAIFGRRGIRQQMTNKTQTEAKEQSEIPRSPSPTLVSPSGMFDFFRETILAHRFSGVMKSSQIIKNIKNRKYSTSRPSQIPGAVSYPSQVRRYGGDPSDHNLSLD